MRAQRFRGLAQRPCGRRSRRLAPRERAGAETALTSRIAAIRCGAWLSSASTSSVCSPSGGEAVTVGFIAENLSGLPAGQWLPGTL